MKPASAVFALLMALAPSGVQAEDVPAKACTGQNCLDGSAEPPETCEGVDCERLPQGTTACTGEDCSAIGGTADPKIETVEPEPAQ